jgi:hypothetical protein
LGLSSIIPQPYDFDIRFIGARSELYTNVLLCTFLVLLAKNNTKRPHIRKNGNVKIISHDMIFKKLAYHLSLKPTFKTITDIATNAGMIMIKKISWFVRATAMAWDIFIAFPDFVSITGQKIS